MHSLGKDLWWMFIMLDEESARQEIANRNALRKSSYGFFHSIGRKHDGNYSARHFRNLSSEGRMADKGRLIGHTGAWRVVSKQCLKIAGGGTEPLGWRSADVCVGIPFPFLVQRG